MRNVDILHLQDSAKLKDCLPKGEFKRLCVVVDERDGDERNEAIMRQRLQ